MKKIKTTIVLFLILLTTTILFFYLSIPYEQIDKLAQGFILKKLDSKGHVSYTISNSLPKDWVLFDDINKSVKDAIVISEDWAFYQHDGVDYNQIEESLNDKFQKGKKLRGASTISQQLVKNLFFDKKRSYLRKFKEYFAVKYLEKKLKKKKILESYLNIIEYGKNTYGIKQASKLYFKKSPSNITTKEAAFLAMLLPSPIKNSQSFKQRKLTSYGSKTINKILSKMKQAKMINDANFIKAKETPFSWEKSINPQVEKKVNKRSLNQKNKLVLKKSKHRSKRKGKFEDRYKNDIQIDVEDNPHFDDDAIKENIGGIKEEFSL